MGDLRLHSQHLLPEYHLKGHRNQPAAAASQQSDAGIDQTMGASAFSRPRVMSEEDDGRKNPKISSRREVVLVKGFPKSPQKCGSTLDDGGSRRKAEVQMNEAAEQHDENQALKEECASLRSSVKHLEPDEAGSLQRILGLERMNHILESQVAHDHGRMKDERNLAMDQLSIKANRLNELETMAYDFNNKTQQLRMENSEISASLWKAVEATNEYQSMVGSGTDLRIKNERTSSRLNETRRIDHAGQIERCGDVPRQHSHQQRWTDPSLEGSDATPVRERAEEWFRSAEKLADL